MQSSQKKLVCLVVPCFNEEQVIEQTHAAIARVMDDLPHHRALVYYVDDGSTDLTLCSLRALAHRDARVRVVALSRNFGQQAAISAGLDLADRRADAILVLDADLENPPELLPRMLEALEQGHDVVMAVRSSSRHTSWPRRLASWSFYRVFNWLSELPIEPGAPDFFLLSRRAREALMRMPERARLWRGMVAWIGFPRACVRFEPPPRAAGTTKYTYRRMFRLAADALMAFSMAPLRALSRLGGLAMALGVAVLVGGGVRAAQGQPDGLLWLGAGALCTACGLQLCALGVVGAYVARAFEQVQGRPLYLVREELGEGARMVDMPGTSSVRVVRGASATHS